MLGILILIGALGLLSQVASSLARALVTGSVDILALFLHLLWQRLCVSPPSSHALPHTCIPIRGTKQKLSALTRILTIVPLRFSS